MSDWLRNLYPRILKLRWFVLVFLAFLAGHWLAETGRQPGKQQTASAQGPAVEGDALYICPMVCVPPMAKPGRCPVCGMDLIRQFLSADDQTGSPTLKLSEEAVRQAEIQLTPVARKFVTADIRLFGRIEYDPVEQYQVTAFAPGVIDRVYVTRAGQTVRAGDPLFDIHSSELFYLEEQLFEVLKDLPYEEAMRPARGQRAARYMRPPSVNSIKPAESGLSPEEKAKQDAAWGQLEKIRRKTQLLGLSEEAFETVMTRGRATGISTVRTPTTGIVLEQKAYKGAYVNTGETIFVIGDLSYLWARLQAYEADFGWLRVGQEAEFQTDAFPGEVFRGTVLYLDPKFDPQTRTFSVGVLYTDPEARLKPNMLVRCVVRARLTAGGVSSPGATEREQPPLVIPDTAPLVTGERAVVYVADAKTPGAYEGREVRLGPRGGGYYVVKGGLKKGELVVANGGFKIDSAVQILARASMMGSEGRRPALVHQSHGGTAGMSSALTKAGPAAVSLPPEANTSEHPPGGELSGPKSGSGSQSYEDRLEELKRRRQHIGR